MILELVASRDLHIWHAFFGITGFYNDINVLNKSPLFIDAIKGEAPRVNYNVNGMQYDMGYYLADRIYSEWAAFVKTTSKPQMENTNYMHDVKKGQGKMSSVHLACGNPVLILLIFRHDCGNRMILLV